MSPRLLTLISMLLISLLLGGCGGGGASIAADGTSPSVGGPATPTTGGGTATQTTAGLNVTIEAQRTGLAKTSSASTGYQWRVHVRATASGDDLVPARTVPAPTADGGSVTVPFGIVPPQAALIVVDVLSPSGALMNTQSSPFTWTQAVHTTGLAVAMRVVMPLTALRDAPIQGLPPAVNLPAGAKVLLGAVGGLAPYQFFIENANTGGTVDPHTGLYTAGTIPGTDDVTIQDFGHDQSVISVVVAPPVSLSPAGATVAPGTKIQFTPTGGQGGGYEWFLMVNRSGGTIDFRTGAYVAGNVTSAVDVVQIRDFAGNTTTATVAVGSPLSITPSSVGVVPGATRTLTARGGSGGYVWRFVNNASGGAIDPQTGAYTAGPNHGVTDVVCVNDGAGQINVVTVPVAAPLVVNGNPGLTVAPGGILPLSGTGGYPPYTWSMKPSNTLAILLASIPEYVAGATPGATDLITLTDSQGNAVTATVTTGPGISLSPAVSTVKSGQTIQFTATGGAGPPYRFSLTSSGTSTIDPNTGTYHAGLTFPDQPDVITVSDTNNYFDVFYIQVTP